MTKTMHAGPSTDVTKRKVTAKKSRNDGKPKLRRALTAYNLYTAFERERILNGTDKLGQAATLADAQRISAEQKARKRRQHRKSHGKIGFRELSQMIAQRWKVLPEAERQVFEQQALVEKMEREAKLRQMEQQRGYEETREDTLSTPRRSISPTQSETNSSSTASSPVGVRPVRSGMDLTQVPSSPQAPGSASQPPIAMAQSLAHFTNQLQASLGMQSQDLNLLTQNILAAMANANANTASTPWANGVQGIRGQPLPNQLANADSRVGQSQASQEPMETPGQEHGRELNAIEPDSEDEARQDPLNLLDDFALDDTVPYSNLEGEPGDLEDLFDDDSFSDIVAGSNDILDLEEPLAVNSLDFDLTEPLVQVDCTI